MISWPAAYNSASGCALFPHSASGWRLPLAHIAKNALKGGSFAQKQRSGFRLATPAQLAPSASSGSRPQSGSKCNEALSRDLWPLDPFESAPMRATSSGMGYCILCAIQLRLEIKELAEMLGGKTGRNSLTLKKLLGGIFSEASDPKFTKASCPKFITWLQSPASLILKTTIQNLALRPFRRCTNGKRSQECQNRRLTAT